MWPGRAGRASFEPSVPETDLAEVAKGKFLRRDAAPLAIRMLDDARDALRQAKATGDAEALAVRSFGISSAYRSALRQFRLWNDRFGGYLADTAQQRTGLPGGPVRRRSGPVARPLDRRLAGRPGVLQP